MIHITLVLTTSQAELVGPKCGFNRKPPFPPRRKTKKIPKHDTKSSLYGNRVLYVPRLGGYLKMAHNNW